MRWFSKKVGGEYELGKTLGKGHFSKVKLGINSRTKRQVAVKIMEVKALEEEQMEEQLKREIAIMRQLDHPNVCKLIDVFHSSKHVYLILELITGGELFDKIVNLGRFPEDLARKYFQQLVLGTKYCHRHEVAHRDLKPENLLLDENGNLKISDFGLSNLQKTGAEGEVTPAQNLHTCCGTPEYAAPEVITTLETKRGYSGFSADVWSCGVILYVMLAGSLPFRDMEGAPIFKSIKMAHYQMKPYFSAGAQDLIRHVLVPNPANRYTLDDIVQHEWFKPGFDMAAYQAISTVEKFVPTDGDILGAVTHFKEGEAGGEGDAPVTRTVSSLESAGSLMRHQSFKDTSFVEKPRNTRFALTESPEQAVPYLKDILEGLNCSVEVKKEFLLKCCFEDDGTAMTFQCQVSLTDDGQTFVEVKRGRGTILQFHEVYRKILEKVES